MTKVVTCLGGPLCGERIILRDNTIEGDRITLPCANDNGFWIEAKIGMLECHATYTYKGVGRFEFLKVLIGLIFLFSLPTFAKAADCHQDTAFLHAIAQKENARHPDQPSAHGELGIYQICPATWAQFSSKPHSCAFTDAVENERVARALLAWLRDGLQRAGIKPTPFTLAEAWNAGLRATQRGKIGAATKDYAQCVVNLIQNKELP